MIFLSLYLDEDKKGNLLFLYLVMGKGRYIDFKVIRKQARGFRKEMTKSEKILWEILRNRKLKGFKFLRQHPIPYKADIRGINYFIADFYCHEKRAVIELDGPVHQETKEYDDFRDNELKDLGLHVLRINNEELFNIEAVKNAIISFLDTSK